MSVFAQELVSQLALETNAGLAYRFHEQQQSMRESYRPSQTSQNKRRVVVLSLFY